MPVLSNTQPTALSLVEGDKLLYTGTCTMQVDLVLSDGAAFSLKSVSHGTFFTIPVAADYLLSVKGSCCNVGGYELFSSDEADSHIDYEAISLCDSETGTLWVQWHKIENDVVTVLTPWTDTGRSCEDPTTTIAEFCVQP